MKKKRLFFAVVFVSIAVITFMWIQLHRKSDRLPPATSKKQTCCEFVPITGFSATEIPQLTVDIEGRKVLVKLDLGFKGDLALPDAILDTIEHKTFLRSIPYYGINGKAYSHNLYQSPHFLIGRMMFSNATLKDESAEFFTDTLILWGETSPPQIQGRLGWELFYTTNLFLDFPNSQIAFCDSIATLQNQGHLTDLLVQTSLFLDRGVPEIDVLTSEGPLRCMLDTGCTWNILNIENPKNLSNKELLEAPDCDLSLPSFKISDKEFGSQPFHRLSIQLPFHVDAILGAEFFHTHQVFIDFANRQVYIAPTTPTAP